MELAARAECQIPIAEVCHVLPAPGNLRGADLSERVDPTVLVVPATSYLSLIVPALVNEMPLHKESALCISQGNVVGIAPIVILIELPVAGLQGIGWRGGSKKHRQEYAEQH